MSAPTHADIWDKMSAIDVSPYIKSRGVGSRTLSWIPWSDCMALLQAHYPNFEYEFFPVTLYPDGSAEVSCEVTIGDVSRRIHLPVMDHKFNAIIAGPGGSPDSRSINDAKMRAFVKAVSILTGLGFQLYRDGSGVPVPIKTTKKVAPKKPTAVDGKKLLAERLGVLGAILEACEEHGGVDSHLLSLGREIIKDGGPLDRADKAIAFLEREVGR